jgi:hypothetical protein
VNWRPVSRLIKKNGYKRKFNVKVRDVDPDAKVLEQQWTLNASNKPPGDRERYAAVSVEEL